METFYTNTAKRLECVDITYRIDEIIKNKTKENMGFCNIFTPHATAAIAVIENFDKNICLDFHEFLRKAIPQGQWLHDRIDGNGDSHIKAAIIGPSETIPFDKNGLMLGRWQSIVLVELDGPRKREVRVTIIKESLE